LKISIKALLLMIGSFSIISSCGLFDTSSSRSNRWASASTADPNLCQSGQWSSDGTTSKGCQDCSLVTGSTNQSNSDGKSCICKVNYSWYNDSCVIFSTIPCSDGTWSPSGYKPENAECDSCPTASDNGTGLSVVVGGLNSACGCISGYAWDASSGSCASNNTPTTDPIIISCWYGDSSCYSCTVAQVDNPRFKAVQGTTNVTASVIWSSSDDTKLTYLESGVFRCTAAGTSLVVKATNPADNKVYNSSPVTIKSSGAATVLAGLRRADGGSYYNNSVPPSMSCSKNDTIILEAFDGNGNVINASSIAWGSADTNKLSPLASPGSYKCVGDNVNVIAKATYSSIQKDMSVFIKPDCSQFVLNVTQTSCNEGDQNTVKYSGTYDGAVTTTFSVKTSNSLMSCLGVSPYNCNCISAGTSTITATMIGYSGVNCTQSKDIKINGTGCTKLTVSCGTCAVKQTTECTASCGAVDVTNLATWTASAGTMASGGMYTCPTSTGTKTVTATYAGKSGSGSVVVSGCIEDADCNIGKDCNHYTMHCGTANTCVSGYSGGC